MKKILIFIAFFLSLIGAKYGYAHPGNTAADGCHYCRTNCDYWGVARNQRHCHGGGKTTTTVSCPSNSYKSGNSCICNSGYYKSGTSCIKEKTCYDLYGINSKDNYDGTCSCKSGYEWNLSNTACVKKTTQCGLNAISTLTGECKCKSGYIWEDINDDKNFNCVKQKTYTEECQEQYGTNSYGDEKYCYCQSGYEWNKAKTSCIKVKEKTGVELCQENYGKNSTSDGIKNINGTYNCTCKVGYEWNISKNNCVIKYKSTK